MFISKGSTSNNGGVPFLLKRLNYCQYGEKHYSINQSTYDNSQIKVKKGF